MKLGELRKRIRNDPNARNCHICAWTATPRLARYVMSGANGQWYDCGEHPDEPNGKPLFQEDIGEWFLKHGLVVGKSEPEVPGPVVYVEDGSDVEDEELSAIEDGLAAIERHPPFVKAPTPEEATMDIKFPATVGESKTVTMERTYTSYARLPKRKDFDPDDEAP